MTLSRKLFATVVPGPSHQLVKAMSKTDNPFVRLVKLAIVVSGSLVLANAVGALLHNVPDWRYVLLFSLAMALSWPRLKLPINTAEILFLTIFP